MTSSESTTVLREIHRLLQPHDDVVGQLEMKSDYLSTKLGGKSCVIRVRIENDPGAHPAIAHAHVVVESEQSDMMHGQLDACVPGLDSDRQEALKAGQPEAVVDRVDHFLTLALGRAIISGDMPIQHAVTYHRVSPSGEMLCDIPLMSEPAFARASALAGELASAQLEAVKQLALSSAEVHAINNFLNAGGKLENCQTSPFIVPDLGTTHAAFERALQTLAKRHSQS